jgi:hypothetical protein
MRAVESFSPGSGSVFQGGGRHCAVPTPEVLEVRKLRVAVEQIVLDHTVEIVVDEQRSIGNQERRPANILSIGVSSSANCAQRYVRWLVHSWRQPFPNFRSCAGSA